MVIASRGTLTYLPAFYSKQKNVIIMWNIKTWYGIFPRVTMCSGWLAHEARFIWAQAIPRPPQAQSWGSPNTCAALTLYVHSTVQQLQYKACAYCNVSWYSDEDNTCLMVVSTLVLQAELMYHDWIALVQWPKQSPRWTGFSRIEYSLFYSPQ